MWTAQMSLAGSVAVLAVLVGCGSSTAHHEGRIAFVSNRAGAVELYLMNADGAGQRRLSRGDAVGYLSDATLFFAPPSWSPDGQWIVYGRDDPATGSEIDIVRADGTGERVLVRDASFPAWSPKGDLIAYTRERGQGPDVWLIHPDGTGARPLRSSAAFPAWSPDGTRVALTVFEPKHADIHTVNLDGSEERRVTRAPAGEFLPAWSTRDRIAFVRDTSTGMDIFAVDADGANERRLTRDRARDSSPAWSPDGSQVAYSNDLTFTREWREGEEIFVVNADGSGRRRLTRNKVRDLAPAWEP